MNFLSNNSMEGEFSFCNIHSERVLNLYCSFCEKPACIICKSTTHARHVTEVKGPEALKKAVTVRRKFLHRLLERKENTVIPKMKSLILSLSEDLAKLHSSVDDKKRKFKGYINSHRDILNLSEKDWLRDLRSRASKYYQLFDDKMSFLRSELSVKEAQLRNLRKNIETLNDPDVLFSFRLLRSNLESIQEVNWLPERISVNLELESVPLLSPRLPSLESRDKNCHLDFTHAIAKPVHFSRIFDTKIPVPKKVLEDSRNKMSICSNTEVFVSFNEYILTYPIDNRRSSNCSNNVRCLQCVTVRDIILDISCDDQGNLFFITRNSVKCLTSRKKIRSCFRLEEVPSALCVSKVTAEIIIGFYYAGKIVKYTDKGDIIAELSHPDPKLVYRPRHIDMNLKGETFFSDDSSTVTILDKNGIWKGSVSKEVKTSVSCAPLRPYGIVCSSQRHLYVIDANTISNLHIFTEDGKYLQTVVHKHIQEAYVVHIDKTGDVWVGFSDGRIRIYRPSVVSNGVS